MSSGPLHSSMRIDPSWFTDPPPIWLRIIAELDARTQLQVANVLVDTQIAVAKAQLQGLQSVKKITASAKIPAAKTG